MGKYFGSEGLIALIYLSAIIILGVSRFGILTIPGIIIALLGIALALKKKFALASTIGILTATGSYIAQYLTAFCPSCTLAATIFAIGGIISFIPIVRSKPGLALLTVPLVISAALLGSVAIPEDTRPMVYITPASTAKAEEVGSEVVSITSNQELKKPQLFFSVTCPSCKKAIEEYVKQDPGGQYWQPVVVPQMALVQGEDMLKGYGYTGSVLSAAKSPGRAVPCLLVAENDMYIGAGKTIAQLNRIRREEGQ